MPFVPAQLAVEGVDSDLLDQARYVYQKEIGCWRVVGPATVAGQCRWLASRNSEAAIAELSASVLAAVDTTSGDAVADIEAMEFSEKGCAMDFVMWRALGKAIAFYNSKFKPIILGLTK